MIKARSFLLSLAVLILAITLASAQDYTCSKTKPCASGCCRLEADGTGNCGLGPTFCGAGNCTQGCDSKGECNPGNWDAKYFTGDGSCPLNVCCGQYGFCGSTPDYCVNRPNVTRPSCSANTTRGRTMAYYEGWSTQHSCQALGAANVPLGYYSHLNLAFVGIDPVTFELAQIDNHTSQQYGDMIQLKYKQPGLQTWVSIGGWAFNDDGPTNKTFSALANSTASQAKFFKSLITFMTMYHFGGVDIDWEYPVAPERGGNPADFSNYVSFLQSLRTALDQAGSQSRLGLSITVPAGYYYLQYFDVANISPIVDYFNLMTYDMHGVWDKPAVTAGHTNLTDIKNALDLLWRSNINPQQVNLGLALYGRSFTLAPNATDCKGAGCPFIGRGKNGTCTNAGGILSASEIKEIILDGSKNVTLSYDETAAVHIMQWDKDQWISYDDLDSFQKKFELANSLCLGGTMIWAVDMDVDGAMAEALATAGHIPRQYVLGNAGISNSSAATFTNNTADSSVPGSLARPYPKSNGTTTANSTGSAQGTGGSVRPAESTSAISARTSSSSSASPSPVGNGTSSSCTAWYLVQKGDGCANIATAQKIDLKDFYSWNPSVKSDCSALMAKYYVCVGISPAPATTITTPLPMPTASAAASSGAASAGNSSAMAPESSAAPVSSAAPASSPAPVSSPAPASSAPATSPAAPASYPATATSATPAPSAASMPALSTAVIIPPVDAAAATSSAPVAQRAAASTGVAAASPATPSLVGVGTTASCTIWYAVQKGDECAKICTANQIALAKFYAWNPSVKNDCSQLLAGYSVCIGVGASANATAAAGTSAQSTAAAASAAPASSSPAAPAASAAPSTLVTMTSATSPAASSAAAAVAPASSASAAAESPGSSTLVTMASAASSPVASSAAAAPAASSPAASTAAVSSASAGPVTVQTTPATVAAATSAAGAASSGAAMDDDSC